VTRDAKLETVQKPRPKKAAVKRRKIITAEVRFDFLLPDDVPSDTAEFYAYMKLKKVCEHLSKKGGGNLTVTPILPMQYSN
jgi:hypothetical protein